MSMTIKDLTSLAAEIRYSCPSCQTLNYIKLEDFENYLDVYIRSWHYEIEFYSPKCVQCGETFVTFIKKGN